MSSRIIAGQLVEGYSLVDPLNGEYVVSFTPTDISLGSAEGVVPVSINGVKLALAEIAPGTTVEEIPLILITSPAGEEVTIRSTNAGDIGDIVRINALGPNYVRLPPLDVTLNGTTPISLSGTLGPITRVNGMSRVSGDLAGNCVIESGGQIRGAIAAGQQIQRSASYTIAAGHRLALESLMVSMTKDGGADASATFVLQTKPVGSTGFGGILGFAAYRSGSSSFNFRQAYAGGIVGPFDVQIVGFASTPNVSAQVYLSGLLIDNVKRPVR